MIENEKEFWGWEISSKDTIDFKKIYVDITGDVISGLLLSQIIYWHLPSKKNSEENKLKVKRNGKKWLVKSRDEWWEECRVSPKQVDRCLKVLRNKGIIETEIYKFSNSPTTHIWLNMENFLNLINIEHNKLKENIGEENLVIPQKVISNLPKGEFQNTPKGNIEIAERDSSYIHRIQTETTPENTSFYKDKEEDTPFEKNHLKDDEKTKAKKELYSEVEKLDDSNFYTYIKHIFEDIYKTTIPDNFYEFLDFSKNIKFHVSEKKRIFALKEYIERLFTTFEWEKIESQFLKIKRELICGYRSECTAKFFETGLISLISPKILVGSNYMMYTCSCGHSIKITNRDMQICPSCELPINYELIDEYYDNTQLSLVKAN